MKKIFALALLIALVLQANAAVDANSPKNIGKSKVFLQLNWSIDFGEGSLPNSFSFKTFGFPTTATQKARMEAGSEHAYAEKTDSLNNLVLEFSFSPKKRSEVVSLRAFVDANYDANQQGEYSEKFLGESELTKANAEIAEKARELRSKAKKDLHALVLLTEWVHNRIKYDGPGYGATVQNAQWVFANQVGTCDEYSHLLVSMLRSLGIPAKFSAGFVCSVNCTRSENWGPHAWVEALVEGQWISSDPTFNEAILLDATHIKFAEGNDQNDIKETLSTLAHNFPLANVRMERSAYVSLDEWEPFEGIELELSAPNATLGEGAIATVVARVRSRAAKAIALPLTITLPIEATVLEKEDALVFVEPGRQAEREWKILLPKKLEQGFIYRFPVKVSSFSAVAGAELQARKGGEQKEEVSVKVVDLVPKFNEDGSLEVGIEILNTGNNEISKASVVLQTNAGVGEAITSLAIADSKKISFTLHPSNLTSVEGNISVKAGAFELTQPIAITLPQKSEQAPGAPPLQQRNFIADLINAITAFILSFFGLK